jgi:hypothetical protein
MGFDDPSTWKENAIGFNKSIDGGVHWGTAERILNITGIRGFWYHKNSAVPKKPIRINSFPSMAVDKSGGQYNGYIYIVWANEGAGSDSADIHLSKSTDDGSTWSTPIKVNNDNTTNDQWFPWITVDSNGMVTITFYDSRNDPNNQLTETWCAESTDGGNTFNNFQVSSGAFTPYPIYSNGYMGDYIGITSVPYNSFSVWMSYANNGKYQAYNSDRLLELASQNESKYYAATSDNHNRVLAQGNNLYESFMSGGEIFVRRTTNGGSSWDVTNRISAGNGNNIKPSMVVYPVSGFTDTVAAVWARQLSTYTYNIYFASSGNSGLTWSTPSVIVGNVAVSSYQFGGPQPVICGVAYRGAPPPPPPGDPSLPYTHRLLIVYTTNSGLKYGYLDYYGGTYGGSFNYSISTSAPGQNIWFPSLVSNGNLLGDAYLTYDARYYQTVYSKHYNASTNSWSSEAVVYDGTSEGSFDRYPCITIGSTGQYIYDTWNAYNQSTKLYFIRFRQGNTYNNTWNSWMWSYTNNTDNLFYPSITGYSSSQVDKLAITEYSIRVTKFIYTKLMYHLKPGKHM